MMLRRLKEDVEKSIASKEETIIEVYTHTINIHTQLHHMLYIRKLS